MYKYISVLLTVFCCLMLLLLSCCNAQMDINVNNIKLLHKSSPLFASKIYKESIKYSDTKNILYSPVSLQLILGLLQLGAENITAEELSKILETPLDRKHLAQFLYQLQNALIFRKQLNNKNNNQNSPDLTLTNAIYVRPDVRVAQDFYNVAKKYLNADIRSLDISKLDNNRYDVVTEINEWISEQTNNKINNMLKHDDISANTVMLLLNVLHFNGKWKNGFNISETITSKFYTNENITIPIPMMHTTGYFPIGRYLNLNVTYLELPYANEQEYNGNDNSNINNQHHNPHQLPLNDYVLSIYLPDSLEHGIDTIESNLQDLLINLPEIHEEQVDVYIPRFKLNSRNYLKPILERLGVKHVFNNAQLESLTVEKKSVSVSDVIHNAVLDVNEEGTEASAVTVIGIDDRIFSQPIPFVANKPFLFTLKQKSTGIILFIGKYSGSN